MISVLVADDSFLMRSLISDLLSADPEIKVVGAVKSGEEVLEAAKRLKPDVITMDMDMPGMDGLKATQRIMGEIGPRPLVIMLSAFTKEKADVTLECLKSGAFDCILKPSGPRSLGIAVVGQRLRETVKAASRAKVSVPDTKDLEEVPPTVHWKKGEFPLVVIGASTGGPPVLESIIKQLSSPLSAAVLIVQHMPPVFTATLAKRLNELKTIRVREAREGDAVVPGTALIAPGDKHMILVPGKKEGSFVVRLTQGPPVHGLRPSIDVLLESIAESWKGPVLGIILTGMGEDGAHGMSLLKEHGGMTLVQSENTCVVDSMVKAAMEATTIDAALPPIGIAHKIQSFALSS